MIGRARVSRIVELSAGTAVDLRATGLRVRLDSDGPAEAVSAAARDLGLAPDPAALQHLSVVLDSTNPAVVTPFWQRVLDYAPAETERRRQRNRIHVELAVPSDLAQTRLEATVAAGGRLQHESAYRRRIADPEGNELVLVSGG